MTWAGLSTDDVCRNWHLQRKWNENKLQLLADVAHSVFGCLTFS